MAKQDLLLELREGRPLALRQQTALTLQLSFPAILAQVSSIVMQYIDAYADRTGNVLLIVGAGGCFASMLGATTMSTDLVAIMSATKMPVILLGFLLAFCIRAAVGSATAAMLTSIAIAGPVCLASGMSPIIAGLSVCLGANAATFPTDVTFWFPSTYNGLDTKDCLATTTIPCILSGAIGMVILVVLNAFSGVLPGMF